MTLEQLEKEAQQLRKAVESNKINDASNLLVNLKIGLTSLKSLPPTFESSPTADQERKLACHIMESATLLSILQQDMNAFERHVVQLKSYSDPSSPLHFQLLGTRLLQLLVEHRMAEFHNELELIPEANQNDPNIAFAIHLEQYLMEGSYNKVLDARSHIPNPYFKFFLSQLLQTVRESLADCAEIAYVSLTLQDAQKMLMFDSVQAVQEYIKQQKPEWSIHENQVWFKPPQRSLGAIDIPSLKLVGETLSYATELDRIV